MSDFFKRIKDHLIYVIKGDDEPSQKDTITVLMQDGNFQTYPRNFIIDDNINGCYCGGSYYHTHLDCPYLSSEIAEGKQPKAIYIKDARKNRISTCDTCFQMSEDYYHSMEDWD